MKKAKLNYDAVYNGVSAILRAAMEQSDLSATELTGRGAASSASNIYRLLSGKRNMTLKTLTKVLDACGYDLEISARPRR